MNIPSGHTINPTQNDRSDRQFLICWILDILHIILV